MRHIITSAIRGGGSGANAWVAKITGSDPKFGFQRQFVRKTGHTSKSGRSGVLYFEITEPGTYEFRNIQPERGEGSIGSLKSGYVRISDDGAATEISKDEVL